MAKLLLAFAVLAAFAVTIGFASRGNRAPDDVAHASLVQTITGRVTDVEREQAASVQVPPITPVRLIGKVIMGRVINVTYSGGAESAPGDISSFTLVDKRGNQVTVIIPRPSSDITAKVERAIDKACDITCQTITAKGGAAILVGGPDAILLSNCAN